MVDPQAGSPNRRRDNISIDGPRVKKFIHGIALTETPTHKPHSQIRSVYPLLLLSSSTPINHQGPAATMMSYHYLR